MLFQAMGCELIKFDPVQCDTAELTLFEGAQIATEVKVLNPWFLFQQTNP